MNKVFVFCPTYRLEPETVQAIHSQTFHNGLLDVFFTRDNPSEDGKNNILHNYQKGRRVFLADDYTHMWVVESDIIPPSNTIERLLALECDLAYGLYCFRHGSPVVNVYRYTSGPYPDQSITMFPQLYKALWGTVTKCSGGGLGCVLIKRRVLEQIEFRREKDGPDCDTYFTEDVYRAGFNMMADTSVICGHKRPDGVVLWPERNE